MKLRDAREFYGYNSGKLSDIVRQLGFAGIALIWVFTMRSSDGEKIPQGLLGPGILIVLALSLDFLQYCSATLAWGAYSRYKERDGTKEDAEFTAPRWINWPALFFFCLKVVVIGVAYGFLLVYLARRFG